MLMKLFSAFGLLREYLSWDISSGSSSVFVPPLSFDITTQNLPTQMTL